MKITICYSMQYAEKAKVVQDRLKELGHEAFVSRENNDYLGLDNDTKEKIKLQHKYETEAISGHFDLIKNSDTILVLNYEKHGIDGYIGGNAFLEMGVAYFLKKPIYLLNPIPKMPYYGTEIIAMKPIALNGNLSVILSKAKDPLNYV